MCGQMGNYGTSAFNVYLNMNEYYHQDDDNDDDSSDEDDNDDDRLMKIQSEINNDISEDFCSMENIQMDNNFDKLQYNSTGNVEDDYDLDI